MADEMVSWSLQSYRPENRRVRHGTGHNADNAEATAEKSTRMALQQSSLHLARARESYLRLMHAIQETCLALQSMSRTPLRPLKN